jgi:hypothetical protein
MPLTLLSLIVNGSSLLVVIVLAILMINAGEKYNFYTGDSPIQKKYQLTILQSIVGIILIGLLAAIFNLFFS